MNIPESSLSLLAAMSSNLLLPPTTSKISYCSVNENYNKANIKETHPLYGSDLNLGVNLRDRIYVNERPYTIKVGVHQI